MSIESRHLFSLNIALDPTIEFGPTPAGERRIFPVSGGSFEGDRVRGKVSNQIGSDLLIGRTDGSAQQDVRLLLVADDGGLILMTYRGIRRASTEVLARLQRGENVPPSEYYLRTTPYFEASAPQHAWLNGIVSVALGGRVPGGVKYEVHEIL